MNFIFNPIGESIKSLTADSLTNDIGHINKLEFDGDYRTKTHLNAAEPVQELLNKFFSNR